MTTPKPVKILVVDDDEAKRKGLEIEICGGLGSQNTVECIFARDITSAYAALKQHPDIALLVTDALLPFDKSLYLSNEDKQRAGEKFAAKMASKMPVAM